jgi:hypothetical protein
MSYRTVSQATYLGTWGLGRACNGTESNDVVVSNRRFEVLLVALKHESTDVKLENGHPTVDEDRCPVRMRASSNSGTPPLARHGRLSLDSRVYRE